VDLPDKIGKIDIPKKAIYRLSIYHRCLQKLKANAVETVSSTTLAKAAGVKPAQLRKDLAYFGQFGTRGLGYPVEILSSIIRETLRPSTSSRSSSSAPAIWDPRSCAIMDSKRKDSRSSPLSTRIQKQPARAA